MACSVVKSRRMTKLELFERAGVDTSLLIASGRQDEIIDEGGNTQFYCGSGVVEVCKCGHMADFLCDYPSGRGKTCDLPLCQDCRFNIGEERDLCEIHWHMFKGKAGDTRVSGKGPRLVK